MSLIALAGVNLWIAREAPLAIVIYPSIWVVLGWIDFVIVWKLLLRRPLRAFHYTFLVLFPATFFVMANQVAAERFHPLGIMIRMYQHSMNEQTNALSFGLVRIAEFWVVLLLSLALADLIGLGAVWLERRRGWDIAAVFRGALVGFGIAALLPALTNAACGGEVPAIVLRAQLVFLGISVLLGGLLGLSKLKSTTLGRDGFGG